MRDGIFINEWEPTTVGELKATLADLHDDMPITDGVGEVLLIWRFENESTGDQRLEFN